LIQIMRKVTDTRALTVDWDDDYDLPRFLLAQHCDGFGFWRPMSVGSPGSWVDRNVIGTLGMLVLDHDEGTPVGAVISRWAGYWGWVQHTRSSRPDHPRCRVLLRSEQLSPGQYRLAWRSAAMRDPGVDAQAADPTRWWRICLDPGVDLGGAELVAAPPEPAPVAVPPEPVWRPTEREPPRWSTWHGRGQIGSEAGGRVSRGYVKHVLCPGCGRKSVWWRLDRTGFASCAHRNSCGWTGPVAAFERDLP
jgi:hypothetical protein